MYLESNSLPLSPQIIKYKEISLLNIIIQECIDKTNRRESRLSQKALTLPGMSSFYTRTFLNHLVAIPHVKYLEVGVWQGSTFYSALDGNNPDYAVAVDNWSQFGGPAEQFKKNMEDCICKNWSFYDQDCFTVEFDRPFNCFFYDGNHDEINHAKALTYFKGAMEDEFIYVCDDWNMASVQAGTRRGIKEARLDVVNEWRITTPKNGCVDDWWNGFYIAVMRKYGI
jgi:hypothetical protein